MIRYVCNECLHLSYVSVLYRISLCVYVVGGEGEIVRFMKHTSCMLHSLHGSLPCRIMVCILGSAYPNATVNSSRPLEHEA